MKRETVFERASDLHWKHYQREHGDSKHPSVPETERRPDEFYVKVLLERLEWKGCEDGEEVLRQFKQLWPEAEDQAERLYMEALRIHLSSTRGGEVEAQIPP